MTITEGETASSIGDALVAARLIGSSREFTDEVTRLEASSALIPGTYTFQGGSTPEARMIWVLILWICLSWLWLWRTSTP